MVKDAVPLGECGRALVIKLRHHGDVLLAAAGAHRAEGACAALEVDALVYDDTAPMLRGHPALSQLHAVGRSWQADGRARSRLRRRKTPAWQSCASGATTCSCTSSEQPRGAWLARALGARYSVAPTMAEPRRVLGRRASRTSIRLRRSRRHMVEVNLDALRRIGVQPGDRPSARSTFVPGTDAREQRSRRDSLSGRVSFIMHPASRWHFKCWPAQNERRAHRPARGRRAPRRDDRGAGPTRSRFDATRSSRKREAKPLNLAGKLSIKELGALTARATLFIGVDSMPMHLAAAMGTPDGGAVRAERRDRVGPVERRAAAWCTSTHTCRPCGIDGCGGGKVSECLTLAAAVDAAVHAAARELLRGVKLAIVRQRYNPYGGRGALRRARAAGARDARAPRLR